MTLEETRVEFGTRRYSPTKVVRYKLVNGHQWQEVEVFEDATVRDNDKDHILNMPLAMLRAYSNDPTWHDRHDEHFVCTEELAKHYGKSREGFVLDADGDIALLRVMGTVLSHHSWGHASEQFIVQVSYDAASDEYNGWGDPDNIRVEKWEVALASPEQIVEALREDEE